MAFATTLPLFITLEGGDGTGKTSQIKRLDDWLTQQQVDHLITREPGGTEVGTDIRRLLLTGDTGKMDPLTETLLFYADRSVHLEQVVRPALANGQWVLSDRFADATAVYQGVCKGIDSQKIQQLEEMVIGDSWPHLTLLLDVPVEVGLARKNPMFLQGLDENRMENEGHAFHEKVRQGLLARAAANPHRIQVIDATPSPDEVFAALTKAIITFTEKRAHAA